MTKQEILSEVVNKFSEEKIIEAIKEQVKILMEKGNIKGPNDLKSSQSTILENDKIIIKCKPEATTSVMWMLQNFVNQNMIEIEKVNGV